MQRLLPYLPDGSAEAAESLITINRDLDGILLLDLPELWAAVRSDASIVTFLDSYLRNALRPFDDGFQELSDIEHAIWRHAAALFVKLLGVRGAGIPLHADRSALLSRLLTVPCMLDACSLFTAVFEEDNDNGAATKSKTMPPNQLTTAISGLRSLRPALTSEFAPAAITIAENLLEVVETCVNAAPAARKDLAMLTEIAEGVAYAKDACLSLCALIKTYPQAAGLLLKDAACQQLIEAVGAVHDQLLPTVENIVASGLGQRGKDPSPVLTNLGKRCLQVEVASEVAVAGLLHFAYLDSSVEDISGGSSSSSSSSGTGASGSSSSSSKHGLKKPASPAAIQRGEALLHAFTLLGHREGGTTTSGDSSNLSLGPALAQRHGIGASIQAAVAMGTVALDEAQTDYIAALLDVSSLAAAPILVLGTELSSTTNSISNNTSSTVFNGAKGIAEEASTYKVSRTGGTGIDDGDDSAVLLSLVSQVKDLLPDFGDGFIATCLDALDRNPERVINALLEGNLPQEVESVDSQLTFEKYETLRKEKQRAEAAFPVLSGTKINTRDTSMDSTSNQTQQQQQKKKVNDSLTAKYLDTKEATYAEKIKAAAIQSQWEYEDEYDDSYDELLHIGADGVTEGEGLGEEQEECSKNVAISAAAAALGGLVLGDDITAGRGSSGRGGGGGRGGRGKKGGKLWVLDGRIYNYPKPGAKEVASEAEAQSVLQQAAQAAKEIHGLGPGGNKPGNSNRRGPAGDPSASSQEGAHEQEGANGGGSGSGVSSRGGGRGGRGGGTPGRGSGGGGSSSSHKYKDKNKASIGNHHRKDRAAQKMSRGM